MPAYAGRPPSLASMAGRCWRQPSLLGFEALWRWLYGVPLLAFAGWMGWRIYTVHAEQIAATGIFGLSLLNLAHVETAAAQIYVLLAPSVINALSWLIPAGVVGWAVFSGVGRSFVLRCYDPSLPNWPAALVVLQLLRAALLLASLLIWFAAIHECARLTMSSGSSDVFAYLFLVLCVSVAVFTFWSLVSWVFSLAPLLVLNERCGVGASLMRALNPGPCRNRLIKVNFAISLLKFALVIVGTIWPVVLWVFISHPQPSTRYAWWCVGTLLYCVVSDFLQVTRLMTFLETWRAFRPVSAELPRKFAASR